MDARAPYDVMKLREDFPILAERPYGKPLVYLDNAASAQKPRQVIERMPEVYEHEYANVHRGLHYLANAATDAYRGGARKVRAFLNAESTDEIIFTKNGDGGDQSRRVVVSASLISAPATRSFCRSWSIIPTSCRGTTGASARARCSRWAPMSTRTATFLLETFGQAADEAHQDRRHHADVERARHR
jgi:hypothetical protein